MGRTRCLGLHYALTLYCTLNSPSHRERLTTDLIAAEKQSSVFKLDSFPKDSGMVPEINVSGKTEGVGRSDYSARKIKK